MTLATKPNQFLDHPQIYISGGVYLEVWRAQTRFKKLFQISHRTATPATFPSLNVCVNHRQNTSPHNPSAELYLPSSSWSPLSAPSSSSASDVPQLESLSSTLTWFTGLFSTLSTRSSWCWGDAPLHSSSGHDTLAHELRRTSNMFPCEGFLDNGTRLSFLDVLYKLSCSDRFMSRSITSDSICDAARRPTWCRSFSGRHCLRERRMDMVDRGWIATVTVGWRVSRLARLDFVTLKARLLGSIRGKTVG